MLELKQIFLFPSKDCIRVIWNTGRRKMEWLVRLSISNSPCSLPSLGTDFNDDHIRCRWMEWMGFLDCNCLIHQQDKASLLVRFTGGKPLLISPCTFLSYHSIHLAAVSFYIPTSYHHRFLIPHELQILISIPKEHNNTINRQVDSFTVSLVIYT